MNPRYIFQEIGVDSLDDGRRELTPIVRIGWEVEDSEGIREEGTRDKLRRVVERVHEKGLKVRWDGIPM